MTATLEAKVQRLLDIEDVKTLKLRYARFCDDGYDPDGIASCFTANGVWDGGAFGRAESREAIRSFFSNTPKVVSFAVHYTTNPIIEVTGDVAVGTWYLWQPMIMVDDNQAMWLAAHYRDRYRREGDQWLIESLTLDIKRFSPYEAGFASVPMAELSTKPGSNLR